MTDGGLETDLIFNKGLDLPSTMMTAEEARSLINDDSMNWISENDARLPLVLPFLSSDANMPHIQGPINHDKVSWETRIQ